MTEEIRVRTATSADEDNVISSLVLAFAMDPMIRWFYKTPTQFLGHFPDFIRIYGGKGFDAEGVHYVGDFTGTAVWLPPGVQPDEEEFVGHIADTVDSSLMDDFFAVFEELQDYQVEEPHWHLPFIGVTPRHQRRGYGSAMMEKVVAECDRTQTIAALESTNPANLSLYLRYGFEIEAAIQAGTSPPLFPMVRQPQSR